MTYDAGTNFEFINFRVEAKIFDIICHQILMQAHWLIEKIEKYHAPIHQAYYIIKQEQET